MIAFAVEAGTIAQPQTMPFPAMATAPDDSFPSVLAQAAMNSRSPSGGTQAPERAPATESAGSNAKLESQPAPATQSVSPLENSGGNRLPRTTVAQKTQAPQQTQENQESQEIGAQIDVEVKSGAAGEAVPQASGPLPLAPNTVQVAAVGTKTSTASTLRETTAKAAPPNSSGATTHLSKADSKKAASAAASSATTIASSNDAALGSTSLHAGSPHGEDGATMPGVGVLPADQKATGTLALAGSGTDTKGGKQHAVAAKISAGSGAASGVSQSATDATSEAPAASTDVADSTSASASATESGAKLALDRGAALNTGMAAGVEEAGRLGGVPAAGLPNALPTTHSAGESSKLGSSIDTTGGLGAGGDSPHPGSLGSISGSIQQDSHGTLRASPNMLEVGVPRGAEGGWLKIRAEVGGDGISASLSTSSHAAQTMLREQLPAINAFLQGEQIHARATVADSTVRPGFTGSDPGAARDRSLAEDGQARREQGQLYRAQEETPELGEDSHRSTMQSGIGVLLPMTTARSGAWLNVIA